MNVGNELVTLNIYFLSEFRKRIRVDNVKNVLLKDVITFEKKNVCVNLLKYCFHYLWIKEALDFTTKYTMSSTYAKK